jgi:penicillin-binding protein 2
MRWRQLLLPILLTLTLPAQEGTDTPILVKPNQPVEEEKSDESASSTGSVFNQGLARTMTISVPAPRGLILDREGRPLAQTKMAYHLALDFMAYRESGGVEGAVAWAQNLVTTANSLAKGQQSYSDESLARYYRHRRWLPKKVSRVLTESTAKSLEDKLPPGLTLLPVYLRYYPQKSLGAHLIGYVGAKTVLPDGPINDGDPLFQSTMGKTGFEKIFDDKLTGTDGFKKIIFDQQGNKIRDELIKRPRPGGNVVTTIDLDWQRYAEKVLREGSKRGAFVVIDIQTGEVLVMASRPTFDLNDFVPFITSKRYKELREDPAAPLFGRAFQSEYPPASTFKPVVTLAAINSGSIRPDETFNCPYKIKIGNKWFRNHSPGHQGWVDAKRALSKSTNPWFYQVGIRTGPQTFLAVARQLGYGSKTGLPLIGEAKGIAPGPTFIENRMGRPTSDGDTANLSIGQGLVTASPLQVAQSMAAIADGSALMQLQLIRQIQDFHGRVIEAPSFRKRNDLNLSKKALQTTHDGMRDVVHSGYGTGSRGDLGFTIMCGKTGTAQWKPTINQNLAWFSGFFPYDRPRYAFAVVYEGSPGEAVSGGRNAAPMVKRFFRNFRTQIKENLVPPTRALVVKDGQETAVADDGSIPKAVIVNDDTIPKAVIVEDDENTIPKAIIVEDDELPKPPVNPAPLPKIPDAIRVRPEPNTPAPPIPTVPGEDEIPNAIPVRPEPEAPADQPRPAPEVPADR